MSIEPVLSPADAEALDALIEAGLNASAAAAAAPAHAARIARLAATLGALDVAPAADRSLSDVTFARVMQARRQVPAEPELSEADSEALESWIMHQMNAEAVPAALRDRARRHGALAEAAIGVQNLGDASNRTDRTLAHVQSWIDAQSEGMTFRRPHRRGRPVLRLSDIISVAAVVLIGCSVVFPIMGALNERQRRAVCLTNLGRTASAMSSYASSNRDSLPIATASLGGGKWWDVDSNHSNSSNLYTLARDGYTTLASLACPGNPSAATAAPSPEARDWRRLEEVSYSYQIMFGPAKPNWAYGPRTVVLADRSPVVLRAIRGELIDPMANAPNHKGAGQHALSNDGSVLWATSPVLKNGDNIWLPKVLEMRVQQVSGRGMTPLVGNEVPASPDDTCLGP